MSVFYCHECGKHVDSDFECCEVHGDELICESCADEIFEAQRNYWNPLYKGEKLAGLIGEKEPQS